MPEDQRAFVFVSHCGKPQENYLTIVCAVGWTKSKSTGKCLPVLLVLLIVFHSCAYRSKRNAIPSDFDRPLIAKSSSCKKWAHFGNPQENYLTIACILLGPNQRVHEMFASSADCIYVTRVPTDQSGMLSHLTLTVLCQQSLDLAINVHLAHPALSTQTKHGKVPSLWSNDNISMYCNTDSHNMISIRPITV